MNNTVTYMDKIEDKALAVLLTTPENAEQAYKDALDSGYDKSDITVFLTDTTRDKYFPTKDTNSDNIVDAIEEPKVGAAVGGVMGALLGGIIAVGTTVTLPGFGVVISGPLLGLIAGSGAGAVAGDMVASLNAGGFPKDIASKYEAGIKAGNVLIGINTNSSGNYNMLSAKWDKYSHLNIGT
jgi:hypothetical protein